MPAATDADTTPPAIQNNNSSSEVSGASARDLSRQAGPQAKAKTTAAAKAGPKAKAESKPAAKAGPRAKSEPKAAAKAIPKAKAESTSSSGSSKKPAASNGSSKKSASSVSLKKPAASGASLKKALTTSETPLLDKAKTSKLSGFDKMADLCKPVVRKRLHEDSDDDETDPEDDEEEEGEEGEEEGLEDDGVVNPDTFAPASLKLDRCKKKKFDQLLESGSLPPKIANMYRVALTLKTGKRDRIRDIVNSAIDRRFDGKLNMNTSKPIFNQPEAHGWLTY